MGFSSQACYLWTRTAEFLPELMEGVRWRRPYVFRWMVDAAGIGHHQSWHEPNGYPCPHKESSCMCFGRFLEERSDWAR
ncbi:hypothetical protein KSP40_PGU018171 [Platanthera guangdongensis]|uniref:Uncharacterized protein n=1 Tax=Platanthera guangdongensis TaxID=2320717 RepID=A0ABR2LI80_9ASPA